VDSSGTALNGGMRTFPIPGPRRGGVRPRGRYFGKVGLVLMEIVGTDDGEIGRFVMAFLGVKRPTVGL
jgi:hypothetical protein